MLPGVILWTQDRLTENKGVILPPVHGTTRAFSLAEFSGGLHPWF